YDRNDVMIDIERLRAQTENKNTVKAKKADNDDLYEEVPVDQPEEATEPEAENADNGTEAEADEQPEQPANEQEPEKPAEDLDD
ncbi:MAG: hypothetical protein K2I75_02925, partial [Clostridiales bacterium]|nr:hypothetical protein [Clostridiales bacterium]